MNSDQYREMAKRTFRSDLRWPEEMLPLLGLGISGEAGEVADIIKKAVYHGHKIDLDKLIEEVGDLMWYIETMLDFLHVPMAQVYRINIEKSLRRYPNGFSKNDSINRTS